MKFDRFNWLKIAACAALTLTAGVASAGDDVLYWMVDTTATVEQDGVTTSVASFFDNYGAPAGSAFAARVRVTGGDIQDGQDVFLDLSQLMLGILQLPCFFLLRIRIHEGQTDVAFRHNH